MRCDPYPQVSQQAQGGVKSEDPLFQPRKLPRAAQKISADGCRDLTKGQRNWHLFTIDTDAHDQQDRGHRDFLEKRQTLTVNGSHAGQLVSSEFQTELREKTRKFEETMRDGSRLHPMVSHGKKTRGMDDLNQRQSPRE
uniref:Uncharacterized protein n=1 Tax=Pipistrellus kuhlii TaxID=59472 RepID=A0A7J7X0X0_PIPKU|nr:hypothetical protein mPipKuh1_010753 [Pipistrellus kuhlii]